MILNTYNLFQNDVNAEEIIICKHEFIIFDKYFSFLLSCHHAHKCGEYNI